MSLLRVSLSASNYRLLDHDYYSLAYYLSVPLSDVEVEVRVPQSEPYLAGMFMELRCSINLDDAVDTRVDVSVMWQKDGEVVNETDRVRILPARLVGGSRYDSSLQFNTLSSNVDSGAYMCISIAFPTESTNYITNSTQTASFSISVVGMYYVNMKWRQLHSCY